MTAEEKKEFLRIAELAIEEIDGTQGNDGTLALLYDLPKFKDLAFSGVRESLDATGNSRIAHADMDAPIVFTTLDLVKAMLIALSVGVDLGATMVRFGAKFPPPKKH